LVHNLPFLPLDVLAFNLLFELRFHNEQGSNSQQNT